MYTCLITKSAGILTTASQEKAVCESDDSCNGSTSCTDTLIMEDELIDETIEEYEVDGGDLFPQIMYTISAALVMLGLGITEGYSSPALDSLGSFRLPNKSESSNKTSMLEIQMIQTHNMKLMSLSGSDIAPISEEEASWIGSLLFAGAFVGSLMSGLILGIGRKWALVYGSIPRALSWFFIAFASNLEYIYVGRFISGISAGLLITTCSVYISEIASPKIRGSLISSSYIFVNLGISLTFILGKYLEWQYLALACAIINLVTMVPLILIPESPMYLISKGRDIEARASLQRLRGPICVEKEFNMLKQAHSKKSVMKTSFLEDLKGLGNVQIIVPVMILILFILIQKFCGYYPIIMYTVQFLKQVPAVMSEHDMAIFISLIQLASSVITVFFIDRGGRKLMGVVSTSCMTLLFLILGIDIYLYHRGFDVPAIFIWSGFVALVGIVSMFCMGLGPLKLVFIGEILPKQYRQVTSAVIGSFMWMSLFASVKLFFKMVTSMRLYGVCWFYSAVCFVGVLFIKFCIPETKGKSIHEVHSTFVKKNREQSFGTFSPIDP